MAGISSSALAFGGSQNKLKYNGKELQSKEFSDGGGLELYDFGKRLQDPQLGRWWVLDAKSDLLEMSSPYVYCFNNPISYADPDGDLAIMINGRVAGGDKQRPVYGQQGEIEYWDKGIIEAIKNSGIPNCSTNDDFYFVDGDRFYGSTIIPFEPFTNKVRDGWYTAGSSPASRAEAGRRDAYRDWDGIVAKLRRDPKTGKIIEKIQIYTHSRGAAFGEGYIETLLKLIGQYSDMFENANNVIDLVYNMGDHQSWGIDEPGHLNAYSQDHYGDLLSGSQMGGLKAAFSSDETSPGVLGAHSTSSFVNDVSAFTKAFANSNGNSDRLIGDFVNRMKNDYGIDVKVTQ